MSEVTPKCLLKRAMIIDDNELDRYVASINIIKYRFAEELIEKSTAMEALQYLLALADTPDLLPEIIFLDIQMPEMTGFQFLEEYEKLPESVKSNCIIMMLSTSLNPGDHERAKSNRYVKRFLNKPLGKDKVELLVSEQRGLSAA